MFIRGGAGSGNRYPRLPIGQSFHVSKTLPNLEVVAESAKPDSKRKSQAISGCTSDPWVSGEKELARVELRPAVKFRRWQVDTTKLMIFLELGKMPSDAKLCLSKGLDLSVAANFITGVERHSAKLMGCWIPICPSSSQP